MSDAIHKYLEYRKAIIDKDNQESILAKKALFEESLKSCDDPLIPDEDGYSLVSYAIVFGDTESVAKILKKIGKFQQANKDTLQLLKDAISANKPETLQVLRDYGIDIDQPEFITTGRTQLAAYTGMADLDACMFLLKNGADLSAVNIFHQPKSIFAYALESKLDSKESDPAKINEFKIKKIQVINLLSIWAWSIGYKPDFGSIKLSSIDSEIIKKVFMIGVKYQNYELALQTSLGFENAYLNIDSLLEKARKDNQFNFKEIYLAFKHCIDAGNNDSKLLGAFDKIKQLWLQHQQEDNRLVLYTLFYMPHTVTSLPEKLKVQALQQQVELEIKPIDNQQFKA